MKYTSNDIQIMLMHPVVSAGQGGAKVVDHPVYTCNWDSEQLSYKLYYIFFNKYICQPFV